MANKPGAGVTVKGRATLVAVDLDWQAIDIQVQLLGTLFILQRSQTPDHQPHQALVHGIGVVSRVWQYHQLPAIPGIYQCNRCHHQTSLIPGTVFHATYLPLTAWFLAIDLLPQRKNGLSVLQLPPANSASVQHHLEAQAQAPAGHARA